MSARKPVTMPVVSGTPAVDVEPRTASDIVSVEAIRVEDRARREYRGIDSLAASIDGSGLLHPIVVTPELRLIAGGRRLEAVKALGWERVPVTISPSLTDMSLALQAESDENTEREPLKPTEAADLARKIESALKPLAAKRQSPGTNQHTEVAGNLPATKEPRPRDVAAKAAGASATTIRKVQAVQEVIASPQTPAPIREIAKAALTEIDATGKVDAGHKKVRAALTAAEAVSEFPDLAYYFDKGDHDTAAKLGNALRGYPEPERSMRVNNLRLTIEAEKRKVAQPAEPAGPDYVKLADGIFVAVNEALHVIEKNGGVETIRNAVSSMNPLSLDLLRENLTRIAEVATELKTATRPTLRRVQ